MLPLFFLLLPPPYSVTKSCSERFGGPSLPKHWQVLAQRIPTARPRYVRTGCGSNHSGATGVACGAAIVRCLTATAATGANADFTRSTSPLISHVGHCPRSRAQSRRVSRTSVPKLLTPSCQKSTGKDPTQAAQGSSGCGLCCWLDFPTDRSGV